MESIAYSRGSITSNEPTDSLRVVNAVLTQLDRIRRFPNVLVLTTSNVTQCIDPAFLDRADIVQYIGPPSVEAIYDIYCQTLHELRRVGILLDFPDLPDASKMGDEMTDQHVFDLTNLARISYGLSGRSVRKVPFLAHALSPQKENISVMEFLEIMRVAAEKQINEKKGLDNLSGLENVIELEEQFLNEEQLQNLQVVDTNGYSVVQLNGATSNIWHEECEEIPAKKTKISES